jgi:hypothetical protein
MADTCAHLDTIRLVTPNTEGCDECLKMGAEWVMKTGDTEGCIASMKPAHADMGM